VFRWLQRHQARIVAALLALSVAAPGLLGPAAARSCCCPHAEEKCHCPVCEHARELESGQQHLKPCASGRDTAASHSTIPIAPPPEAEALVVTLQLTPRGELFQPPDPLQREVPTPPPLR
jgi:hypothetical protein